jgi:hypothetical protein
VESCHDRHAVVMNPKKTKNRPIPQCYDPVAKYPLPKIGVLLNNKPAIKVFRQVWFIVSKFPLTPQAIEKLSLTKHLDCYIAIKQYEANPTPSQATSIFSQYLSPGATDSLRMDTKQKTINFIQNGINSFTQSNEKHSEKHIGPPPTLFQDFREEISLPLKTFLTTTFKTTPEFDLWLKTQGTSIKQLQDDWWKINAKTKNGNYGVIAKWDSLKKGYEIPDNAISMPSDMSKVTGLLIPNPVSENSSCQIPTPWSGLML